MPRLLKHKTTIEWLRNLFFLALIVTGTFLAMSRLWKPHPVPGAQALAPTKESTEGMDRVIEAVDDALMKEWRKHGVEPAPLAPNLTQARRLSLALTGTVPSLQEIRAFEAQPEDEQLRWWISHLFADRRSSDYLAERLARAFVGVEDGPFFVFRRRRLVDWLSDALHENRPYDRIARELISSKGVWTTRPETNFVTATIEPEKGPDRSKLAARVSRAFLGVRIDCVQCHDGKLDSPWKQRDFHRLAAFFGQTEMSLAGLQDNPKKHYEYRFLREPAAETVPPVAPWSPELLPETGEPRARLAGWVTDPRNRPFARAIVNRVWALLFNRPLITPVDDIPLEGPFPPGLEILAEDFTAHGNDLRRLIRVIAATRAFQSDSHSADTSHPVTEAAEKHWAAFPMTRLRPEQMAGSIIQAASLTTIDAESHVLHRVKRLFATGDFLKRYGDLGEDEFGSQTGTIPQRLLMMNGEVVQGHLKPNPILNASTRIGTLAPDDGMAVETAYLAIFCRRPTPEEAEYFAAKLRSAPKNQRGEAMADLYWALMNATEFSWNH
jgi:hypothetical protein